jgi:hypothetical protein
MRIYTYTEVRQGEPADENALQGLPARGSDDIAAFGAAGQQLRRRAWVEMEDSHASLVYAAEWRMGDREPRRSRDVLDLLPFDIRIE